MLVLICVTVQGYIGSSRDVNTFVKLDRIGEGTYGTVCECTHSRSPPTLLLPLLNPLLLLLPLLIPLLLLVPLSIPLRLLSHVLPYDWHTVGDSLS